jgi:hypothetical protein
MDAAGRWPDQAAASPAWLPGWRAADATLTVTSLPSFAVTTLIALNVVRPTLGLAIGAAAVLLLLSGLG